MQFEEQAARFTAIESKDLEKALACEQMYTGELFEERSYEWSITERIRLHKSGSINASKS